MWVCTGVCDCAQVCMGVRGFVHVCTCVRGCTQVCVHINIYAWVCTGVLGSAWLGVRVGVGLRRSMREFTVECAGVHMCEGIFRISSRE